MYLGTLELFFQIAIIILMGPNHDQFKIFFHISVRQKILNCFDSKFLNVDSSQISFFIGTDGWIFSNELDLFIKLMFLTFTELLYLSLKGS